MIAIKGQSNLILRRSKNSLSSFSQATNADLSQSKLRRSTSSLYLQGLAMDDTTSTTSLYSQSSNQYMECPATSECLPARGHPTVLPIEESGGKTLFQAILMLTMA